MVIIEEDKRRERIAIIGGAKTGKTYYSETITTGDQLIHADDSMGLSWSDHSEFISHVFDLENSDYVVEGLVVVRALRKWLKNNPKGQPCDLVVYLEKPRVLDLSSGQKASIKAVETIFKGIEEELINRGVLIEYGDK